MEKKILSSNFSFICRASKADRNGKAPIEVSIIINGSRTYLRLPMKCDPKEFSALRSQKRNNWLKEYLNSVYSDIQRVMSQMQTCGARITAENLKDAYVNGVSAEYTVGMLCSEYLSMLKVRVDGGLLTLGNYAKYERVLGRLEEKTGSGAPVTDITNAVVLSVLTDLRVEFQPATVSNYWTKLKSAIRFAIDNGRLQTNPCSGIKVGKGEREIEVIDDGAYCRLRDKAISINRLEKVRDLFIFACNSGLSFCDVVSLSPDDFKVVDGRWVVEKERQKTGVKFYSVILEDGVRILQKYGFDLSCLFLSNQRCNSYLKELQDICCVGVNLTFHKARHFYITFLIRSGVPVSIVQKCAGHSNIRMTNRYTHLCCSDVVEGVSRFL